ncbi:hypothetical protein KY363_06230 [Candidatus Woesearchaeota archaeon]|nr:hypothetical protein [Candidatus Woesearchaeota archaeon]
MRRIGVLCIIAILVLLAFSIGCSKEDDSRKTVASRPVTAEPKGEVTTAPASEASASTETETVTTTTTTKVTTPAGTANCEQLSTDAVAAVLGGTWAKTSDCPQRPAMPKGVDVCRCDYDGPKQVYVNVETQLYTDSSEALRVFNMYCKSDEGIVGEKSCKQQRTDSLRPNYVFFLKGNYFVKVSCLGGTCPLDAVASLAKGVESEM